MGEAERDTRDAGEAGLAGRAAPARRKRTGEDRILTVPNAISLVRLALIPVFFVIYVCMGQVVAGTVVFAVAAATDWLDGTVARSTGTVTKLGRALDPFIDRILIIVGIISVVVTGRAPLWIMILIFARDIILGILTIWMRRVRGNAFTVSYVGKCATACMLVAFCMLMLDWPMVAGLGLAEVAWLPGLGAAEVSFGIFLAYIGVVLQWTVAAIYLYRGLRYGSTAPHGAASPTGAPASPTGASASTQDAPAPEPVPPAQGAPAAPPSRDGEVR